jgi:hypothetical protein
MRIDPIVNRSKYDRELGRLQDAREIMRERGIFLLSSNSYPLIDFLFVPRHLLRAVVPISQQGSLFLPPGAVAAVEIPGLSARAFKAHFDLSNYDLDPPSLEFRDPWTDELLAYNTMFRAIQFDQYRKGHVVLLDDHPKTHKPFLCMRGIREYHEHPQHSGDEWLLYREDMNMFSIVMSLWRVAIDLLHPVFMMQEHGAQVQWTAEEKL